LADFIKESKVRLARRLQLLPTKKVRERFSLDEKVPRRTIEARKRRLMKLQQSISKRANSNG